MIYYNEELGYLVNEDGIEVCQSIKADLESVEKVDDKWIVKFRNLPVHRTHNEFDTLITIFCLKYSGVVILCDSYKFGVLLDGVNAKELGLEYMIYEQPIVGGEMNEGIFMTSTFGFDLTVENYRRL